MSFEDGEAYNKRLMLLSEDLIHPDRSIPVDYITYDLGNNMHACDHYLANQILEPVFDFMRTQADPKRKEVRNIGAYLEYRERDIGQGYVGLRDIISPWPGAYIQIQASSFP